MSTSNCEFGLLVCVVGATSEPHIYYSVRLCVSVCSSSNRLCFCSGWYQVCKRDSHFIRVTFTPKWWQLASMHTKTSRVRTPGELPWHFNLEHTCDAHSHLPTPTCGELGYQTGLQAMLTLPPAWNEDKTPLWPTFVF